MTRPGGVVDNTPLSVALAAGARRIYVLLCSGVNSRSVDVARPYEALLVAFGLSIRTRLRRDLASIPADVDVIVLEQSGVEDLTWQDFSRTEELLERGYLDARVVLDRVEPQLAERRGIRSGTRWWSRSDGRPSITRRKPVSSVHSDSSVTASARLSAFGPGRGAGGGTCTSASGRNRCSR